MDTPLISIIIPIYRAESFLDRCLRSVVSQTLSETEILLVLDGASSDGSLAICRAYQARDVRIKIIQRPHGGVSAARNAGLEAATGEYIGFVDADDWLEANMYEQLYQLCRDHHTLMSVCNLFFFDMVGKERVGRLAHNIAAEQILNDQLAYQAFFFPDGFGCYSFNKLYHRSLFKGPHYVRFNPALTFLEDRPFQAELLRIVNGVAISRQAYYHYYVHKDSASQTKWKTPEALATRALVVKTLPEAHASYEKSLYLRELVSISAAALKNRDRSVYQKMQHKYQQYAHLYNDDFKKHRRLSGLGSRLLLWLVRVNFDVACHLYAQVMRLRDFFN